MADASADPRIGKVIEDRYRILGRVASGGMGVVYRAERMQLGRTVAIKFLDAANAADENSRARFEREAKAMSRLSHPHCVSVIDFGVADTPFIVMDYVIGQPLITLIHTKKKVEATRAASIMKQVMAGLAHAHRHEVIHRDVKPANIMLTEATGTGDFVRILDFGLAKLRGASSLSSANIVVGTPSYMSPEQASGKTLDARSDIYSAGVVLYELLTGDKPFVGEDAFETLRLHQDAPVPLLGSIRGSDEIRVSLDAVIQKAMAKKPKNRYQTALSMSKALARVEESNRDLSPRGKRADRATLDPARATTQLPSEAVEKTEILGGHSTNEPTRSLFGALVKTIVACGVVVVLGVVGWRVWQSKVVGQYEDAREPKLASVGLEKADGGILADSLDTVHIDEGELPPLAAPDAGTPDAAAVALDAATADAFGDARSLAGLPDGGAAVILDEAIVIDDAEAEAEEAEEAKREGASAVPSGPPRSAGEAIALSRAGKPKEAIAGLHALIKANPKNGYLHRTMGDFNVARGWWSEAIKNYTKAVRLVPRYKRFKSINQNAIRALGFPKVRRRAERFIRYELGSASFNHLRAAARSDSNPTIRKRADWLSKRVR